MKSAIKFCITILIFCATATSPAVSRQPAAAQSEGAQLKVGQDLWREAVGIYTTESADYIQTAGETLDELRFWRQKILSDQFEEKITHFEIVLSKSNTEALNELQGYLTKGGIDALDDSLMMRLAQLEYDRANFDMTDKMRRYDGEMSQFQAGLRKDAPALPTPDYTRTIYYTSELIHRFPNSPLTDKAQYLLGYCYYDEGHADKAEKIYDSLVTLHPYSDLAPETHWRLAESYFDDENYKSALTHYKVLAEGTSAFSQKALYKEGATFYAIGKFAESGAIFLQLYKNVVDKLGSSDPEAETLYDESIDYLAHLRAKNIKLEASGPVDEEIDALVTKRLASIYHRAHEENLARQTYLKYVASHSVSKWSPEFMNNVSTSYADENQLVKAQEIRDNFVKALGPSSPYWTKFKNDQTTVLQYEDLYEGHVLASAEFYGDQARRTKRPADYATAIVYYRKFIDEYSSSPLRVQALFELGELEYFAGKYLDASRSYLAVINSVDAVDYLEEASYGYFLAEVKRANFPLQRSGSLRANRDRNGVLLATSPVSDSERAFLRAAQMYVDHVPTGARRQRILYRIGEIFFEHNDFIRTRSALELLLKDSAETSLKVDGLRLIAVTYDLENNWEKLVEANRRLASAPLMADDGEDYSDHHNQTPQLNVAWHLEASGALEDAAIQYEQFAITFPDNSDAAFATYHAALLYRKTAAIAASDRLLNRVLKEYKLSSYATKAEFFRAANLQSMIRFEQAAQAYEEFSRLHARDPFAVQAFFNAGMLRKGMGQYEKAAADLTEYNRRVNDDEVTFEIADLYWSAGKADAAVKVLNPFTSGKYGRDLFLRAVFSRALNTNVLNASTADLHHSLEDCVAIDAAMKISSGFSAHATQAVSGCTYIRSLGLRNEVLSLDVTSIDPAIIDQKFGSLLNAYSKVQATKSNEWTILATADAGFVAETLANKIAGGDPARAQTYTNKALAFYKKALEIKRAAHLAEVPDAVVNGLSRLAPETLALYDELSYWSLNPPTPHLVVVSIPPEAAALRTLFDSSKWDQLQEETQKEIKEGGPSSLYVVKARALAELGRWKEARETLKECADSAKDRDCVSSLLQLGYSGEQLGQYRDLLESALKTETHASWKLGLAEAQARDGRTREALGLALDTIGEDSKAAAAYNFVAKLFIEAKKSELAKIVLEEGLKNSEGDDSLKIQLAHLELSLRLIQPVDGLIEDFKDQDIHEAGADILAARAHFIKGKEKETSEILEKSVGAKSDILTAQFYFALQTHDVKKLAQLSDSFVKPKENTPQGNYLLSLYFNIYKHDAEKAGAYLALAKEDGLWGHILEVAKNMKAPDRQPAQENKK